MTPRPSRLWVLPGLLTVALAVPGVSQPPDPEALRKRLADLLTERAAELRKEVAARTTEYKDGRGTLDILLEANRNLGWAELELTDDPKQRAAAHERLIQAMRDIEAVNKGRFEAGRISAKDYKQTQAERALAEINFIQEQLQGGGTDKNKLIDRVGELRRERLAALQAELDGRVNEYRAGRGTLDLTLVTYRNVGQAELDLAADPRQRRQAQDRLLRALQEIEDLNQRRFDGGRIPIQDLLQTRAARLEAEIAVGGDRVAQQRQELVTVRRQEVEARMEDFRAGRGTLDILLDAQLGLARAELALTDDVRRQVAIQERAVKVLRDVEEFGRTRFEAGQWPVQDFIQSRAARMTAEIDLVRLQQKPPAR
jgi:hypothetical protein